MPNVGAANSGGRAEKLKLKVDLRIIQAPFSDAERADLKRKAAHNARVLGVSDDEWQRYRMAGNPVLNDMGMVFAPDRLGEEIRRQSGS